MDRDFVGEGAENALCIYREKRETIKVLCGGLKIIFDTLRAPVLAHEEGAPM